MSLVTWEASLGWPLVIDTLEDQRGSGTVSTTVITPDASSGNGSNVTKPKLLGLYVPTKPDWLQVEGEGSDALQWTVALTDSPFAYEVESVQPDLSLHVTRAFTNVGCDLRTFRYTRLDSGIITVPIEVQAVLNVGTEWAQAQVILRANYSIGRDLLTGALTCQP